MNIEHLFAYGMATKHKFLLLQLVNNGKIEEVLNTDELGKENSE